MPLIRPFSGLRPRAEFAAQVLAPPYDVVTEDEARARAAGRPWSFLHISRPEIDLPPGTDPYAPEVYRKGRENFERQIAAGVLARDPEPCYYLYRLVMGAHTQTGLVAAASVAAYEHQRIRRHEHTRPDKEDDRVRQIEALDAQTGPVFLTYRHRAGIDRIVVALTSGAPEVDVTADDGVRHSLWVVRDPDVIGTLTGEFEAADCLYVADGHHRSAAAARVAAARRSRGAPGAEGAWDYFLSVIFPDDQMQILPYNRVVRDLHGLTLTAFLERVAAGFDLQPAAAAVTPGRAGEFGMYCGGTWYRLAIHAGRVPADDPVRRLDVSLLADNLLEPVLGIQDPRRDKRIDFVGGIRGVGALQQRVDSGEMAVAFSMFPTALSDLMAVADAGQVMPPKSTWFEPKLADGLVSQQLD
ncbi:MAG: DUF1015 family protein [Gammaproteobacteria bacterium]|nr:DUF1015 family protein [Gammaproteobacteria bacterium]